MGRNLCYMTIGEGVTKTKILYSRQLWVIVS